LQNHTLPERIIGHNIIMLDRVSSTNDFLKDYVSNFKPLNEGTAILAVDQFQGRGQRDNKWVSEPGKNITCSFHLTPTFLKATQQFPLNIGISLGLAKYLQSKVEKTVKIKWPNDIYVENKKIAGILIENTIQAGNLKHSIIGIGVNINQKTFNPEDSIHRSSLLLESDQTEDYDIKNITQEIFNYIETEYKFIKSQEIEQQLIAYNERLFRKDEKSSFLIDNIEQSGVIKEVCLDGKLIVALDTETKSFNYNEIKILI